MEAISARFAPFPPRRFFISARPSAWKSEAGKENSQNVPSKCKDYSDYRSIILQDQQFEIHLNTLHLHPMVGDPSCLAISKVVDPLCHGESKIRILITSWTPEPQMQLQRTRSDAPVFASWLRGKTASVSESLTRNDTSHVQKIDDALISDELNDLSTAASAARCCLPFLFARYLDLAVA